MLMRVDQEKHVKQIMAEMQCAKDFACYHNGFENLCRAQAIGETGLAECCSAKGQCMQDNSGTCEFRLSYGGSYLCKCALRVYLAKYLNL